MTTRGDLEVLNSGETRIARLCFYSGGNKVTEFKSEGRGRAHCESLTSLKTTRLYPLPLPPSFRRSGREGGSLSSTSVTRRPLSQERNKSLSFFTVYHRRLQLHSPPVPVVSYIKPVRPGTSRELWIGESSRPPFCSDPNV